MRAAAISPTQFIDTYALRFTYDQGTVDALRDYVPGPYRDWIPSLGVWTVHHHWADQTYDFLTGLGYAVEVSGETVEIPQPRRRPAQYGGKHLEATFYDHATSETFTLPVIAWSDTGQPEVPYNGIRTRLYSRYIPYHWEVTGTRAIRDMERCSCRKPAYALPQ
ncbi:hypothetical protein KUG88_18195 [Rhodococcus rhodochrous]|uniref:hypothetical protein n=1 Tax=Rhodococcus rhodochrous TaxID=1829 RepID=UPI001E417951|nr:hypothetical protein [Rhodococcus rhodochrous]MCB8912062.1 hypothetical protein [Rhodococcus rhodochrous]